MPSEYPAKRVLRAAPCIPAAATASGSGPGRPVVAGRISEGDRAPLWGFLPEVCTMRLSCLASAVVLLAIGTSPAVAQQASGNFVITGVQLSNFQVVDNVLQGTGTVTGTLAGLPFTTVTNLALNLVANDPETTAVECAILDLQLAPIQLSLLGLFVDTSAICLEITATEGGGLLGDLLCNLAGGGLLTGDLLGLLQGELQKVLNEALGTGPNPASGGGKGKGKGGGGKGGGGGGGGGGGDSICRGDCEILELVLGPVELTILGLNVFLDNCANGPIQVCVSASRGQGILGDLLCGLVGRLGVNLSLADITQLIQRALALSPGGFTLQEIKELQALLAKLIR